MVSTTIVASQAALSVFDMWHRKLEHLSCAKLSHLASCGALGHVPPFILTPSMGGTLAKQIVITFPSSTSMVVSPYKFVNSRFWGPVPVVSKE